MVPSNTAMKEGLRSKGEGLLVIRPLNVNVSMPLTSNFLGATPTHTADSWSHLNRICDEDCELLHVEQGSLASSP